MMFLMMSDKELGSSLIQHVSCCHIFRVISELISPIICKNTLVGVINKLTQGN